MRWRERTPLLILLALPLACAGCAVLVVGAVAAGAALGVVKYTGNEALRDYEAGLGATWEAARAQLEEMGYQLAAGIGVGPRGGTIETGDAKVEVELFGDYTRVTARFGTFETDESRAKARQLLEGIAARLGE